MSGSMSGMWKRITVEPLRHARRKGGNRYVRPTATAPHLDSTKISRATYSSARQIYLRLYVLP